MTHIIISISRSITNLAQHIVHQVYQQLIYYGNDDLQTGAIFVNNRRFESYYISSGSSYNHCRSACRCAMIRNRLHIQNPSFQYLNLICHCPRLFGNRYVSKNLLREEYDIPRRIWDTSNYRVHRPTRNSWATSEFDNIDRLFHCMLLIDHYQSQFVGNIDKAFDDI